MAMGLRARRIAGHDDHEYSANACARARGSRYEDKEPDDNHTFLVTVDAKTGSMPAVNGNEARYIIKAAIELPKPHRDKRIFIEAIGGDTIQPAKSCLRLFRSQRDNDDAHNVEKISRRSCGARVPRKMGRRHRSREDRAAIAEPMRPA